MAESQIDEAGVTLRSSYRDVSVLELQFLITPHPLMALAVSDCYRQ